MGKPLLPYLPDDERQKLLALCEGHVYDQSRRILGAAALGYVVVWMLLMKWMDREFIDADTRFNYTVAYALSAVVLGAIYKLATRRRFRRLLREALSEAGRCGECGYDLVASPDRCPECGTSRRTIEPVS